MRVMKLLGGLRLSAAGGGAGGRVLKLFLVAIVLGAAGASAQIVVSEAMSSTFNRFGAGFDPRSGDITHAGDVFVAFDLEVGVAAYLRGRLYMYPESAAQHQYLYFSKEASRSLEWLLWDWDALGGGSFFLTDDLLFDSESGGVLPGGYSVGTNLSKLDFIADRDANALNRGFRWFFGDPLVSANRIMDLDAETGNLLLAGTLSTGVFFSDIAESFWMTLPVAAGEVVAIDPERPDAVVPAAQAADPRIVGIVSTQPAISLGWGAMSVQSLRNNWGDEVADLFQRDRSRLESEALATDPRLQRMSALRSDPAALLSEQGFQAEEAGAGGGDGGPSFDRERARAAQLEEALAKATLDYEQALERAALDLFFQERVARVALAGRVPVKADASFGPIRIGDPLTSSPVRGRAMKATPGDSIVGIALEELAIGQGEVMTQVRPGWAPGSGIGEVARLRRRLADRELHLSALDERLQRLESALVTLAGPAKPAARPRWRSAGSTTAREPE